jgi:biotin carboxylase
MVSRFSGIVRSLPGEAFIRSLPSFRSISWEVKPGEFVHKTIDCFTRPGCVQLVGDTEEAADRDLEAIHDLELNGLIDYVVICPNPPSIGAVAVVDPYSTGANIAAQILKWGYRLILIFSEVNSPVATLVSKGTKLQPTLIVQHDNRHPDQEIALQQTLQALVSSDLPILAIIPGSEPGVELADRLSVSFGTRSNPKKLTEARRNKYKMQEVIRSHGIRAAAQKLAATEEDVLGFVKQLQIIQGGGAFGNFKCVIKPNESGGTDSVFLCNTTEECLNAFNAIHGQINGLGNINVGALCQEYLQGNEYALDGVSRDGVYKVTAIWKYDKRTVNGANFVYFGMRLCDANEPGIKELLTYAASVVKALGLLQGPSHMEIILNSFPTPGNPGTITYSPCLVEVGARCHGGEGSWIPVVTECIGYSQVEVALNCYLRPDRFDELPAVPKLLKYGKEAFLVSYVTGTILDIPGLDVIRSLSSFRYAASFALFSCRMLKLCFFVADDVK